jgi:hypothetical protein
VVPAGLRGLDRFKAGLGRGPEKDFTDLSHQIAAGIGRLPA